MADRYTRRINLYINDKEVRNDIASIRKEMTKMQSAQNRMIVGSKEYVAQGKKIAMLRGIMTKHQNDIRKTSQAWFSLNNVSQTINKYMSSIMAAAAAFTAIIMGLRKAAQEAMLFEERLDNLSALTGLEGRQLEWLGNQAKETSVSITDSGVRIKQAASDIVDAYTKVGSQRPELLRNKEALHEVTKAAIILSEAAKSDLEPAVKGLAMAMNQHNLGATQANRIINAMSAGSKLGAANIPYLTQAIEKSGTTLNLMNLELEDNIALVEAIAPSFSEAAAAGTSLDRTFLKMKAMNIGYKDGVFDVSRALEELRYRFKNGESAVDLFGLRHAKMAEILVKNREEFKRFRKGIDGTSIAFEQAQKNTDNTATKLAQAKNKLTLVLIEFGEVINPIFLKSTNLIKYMIKGLVVLPKFIRDNQVVLISLATALMAYNAALLTSIALQIKKNILNKWELTTNAALVLASSLRVAVMQLQILFLRKQTAAQVAHVAALKTAIFYEQAFNKALMANPIGIVIAGLGLMIAAIKGYDKYSAQAVEREKEKEAALKNLNTANEAYAGHVKKVTDIISEANKYSRERKEALKEEIDETIRAAEAQLVYQQSLKDELFIHNNQASLWQKSVNIFKSGGNAALMSVYNLTDGLNNATDAAATMDDGIYSLKEKINLLKQSDNDLYKILNAEAIGDEIGTGSLAELEEKLSAYQTAYKNLKIGGEEFLRVQTKIAAVEKQITVAREAAKLSTEEQMKKEKLAAENLIKTKIKAVEAIHNLEMAAIQKSFLEGKINSDQQKSLLLQQELKFLKDKMAIYKVGSLEYAKAYNESLIKQTEAKNKIDELSLKANQVLRDAEIANFEEGIEKEYALLNQAWDKEKETLEKQLIDKEELSQKEIELNETINQTIEEKTSEHLLKLQALKDAFNIGNLENLADAAEPLDEHFTQLEQLQAFHNAKQNLIEAQYAKEKELAGTNQSALLATEANYNRKTLANKNALIDAEFKLTETKIATAQGYLSALKGVFKEETIMGKALFLFNQGLAIAEIWVNVAKANAKALAASPLTFGQPWVTANTVQGGISSALVLAQTVAKVAEFANGRYPVQGESGNMYNANYASRPQTGIYTGPQLGIFNEVPGQPEMVIDGLTTKKINVNHPEIMQAIYNVRDGRIPQFADGKYPDSSIQSLSPSVNQSFSSNPEMKALIKQNTTAMESLKNLTVIASIETIEKELGVFFKMKNTTGL
jgi:TP901 family phage tail tape measure protein